MCGCGGSTQPAVPPQQTPAREGEPVVTVTEVGPAAPGYFWTGPPSYAHQHVEEPAPAE